MSRTVSGSVLAVIAHPGTSGQCTEVLFSFLYYNKVGHKLFFHDIDSIT